jgi:hypothetical protein
LFWAQETLTNLHALFNNFKNNFFAFLFGLFLYIFFLK